MLASPTFEWCCRVWLSIICCHAGVYPACNLCSERTLCICIYLGAISLFLLPHPLSSALAISSSHSLCHCCNCRRNPARGYCCWDRCGECCCRRVMQSPACVLSIMHDYPYSVSYPSRGYDGEIRNGNRIQGERSALVLDMQLSLIAIRRGLSIFSHFGSRGRSRESSLLFF